jgi:ribosome-associated translation inhibitor RaiA
MGTSENEVDGGFLALGGNIELAGFSSLDRDSLIVLKKIVGNYAKKFSEMCKSFQKLSLKMKQVHVSGDERAGRYELHALLADGGKTYVSEHVDYNLFVAVDKVFKKIESELSKEKLF